MTVKLAILGVTGRMGRCLVRAIGSSPDYSLVGALASPASPWLGHDAGDVAGAGSLGVEVTADPGAALSKAEVAIDFTLPGAFEGNLGVLGRLHLPWVVGVTGLNEAQQLALRDAAHHQPILASPNMSVGVNLLFALVAQAAAALSEDYDIEVVEAHHRNKRDAPSGTALRLGEVAAGARGRSLREVAVEPGRPEGPRTRGGIGFAVLRGGDIVGEHTVRFLGEGESVELVHRATDRMAFAHGALLAAGWLRGRPAGFYGMPDVLGLKG